MRLLVLGRKGQRKIKHRSSVGIYARPLPYLYVDVKIEARVLARMSLNGRMKLQPPWCEHGALLCLTYRVGFNSEDKSAPLWVLTLATLSSCSRTRLLMFLGLNSDSQRE